jgi:hypothetical protein
MKAAKLSTLYFALTAVLAVAAAVATPCLVVPHQPGAHSVASGDAAFPMDARIALAR